jgi:hypothetical protein
MREGERLKGRGREKEREKKKESNEILLWFVVKISLIEAKLICTFYPRILTVTDLNNYIDATVIYSIKK